MGEEFPEGCPRERLPAVCLRFPSQCIEMFRVKKRGRTELLGSRYIAILTDL